MGDQMADGAAHGHMGVRVRGRTRTSGQGRAGVACVHQSGPMSVQTPCDVRMDTRDMDHSWGVRTRHMHVLNMTGLL